MWPENKDGGEGVREASRDSVLAPEAVAPVTPVTPGAPVTPLTSVAQVTPVTPVASMTEQQSSDTPQLADAKRGKLL